MAAGSGSFGISTGARDLTRGKGGSIKRTGVSFATQETNAPQRASSKARTGTTPSSPLKAARSLNSSLGKSTVPEGSRLIKRESARSAPPDAPLGEDKATDGNNALLAGDAVPKPVAKAPAFTGDPRDKGLATMAQNLSRRRKKAA